MNRLLCHWCEGSGKDVDAEAAASPDRCPYCHGTGFEEEEPEEAGGRQGGI